MARFTEMLLFALSLLLLCTVPAGSAAALTAFSMSPGAVYVDFEPNAEMELSFGITSREDSTQEIGLLVAGSPTAATSLNVLEDLDRYISLDENRISLAPGETRQISFTLAFPEKMEFGVHRGKVVARLVPQGGAGAVGASNAVVFQVFATRLFLRKYGEIKNVQISAGAAGEPVGFKVFFWNLGAEPISSARVEIGVLSPRGWRAASIVSDESRGIGPGEIRELTAELATNGFEHGIYTADARALYDGSETQAFSQEFRLLLMVIDILGVENEPLNAGQASDVNITVKSRWHKAVYGVFADVELLRDGEAVAECETEPGKVSAHSEANLTCRLDLADAEAGTYSLRATLHYAGNTSVFENAIVVSAAAPQTMLTGFTMLIADAITAVAESPLMLALLAVAVCLIAAGLALHNRRKRRRITLYYKR